jgi:hypothetical protein
MRGSALPSRTNQARVILEILDLAQRENFRVNLFEAYDELWKQELEGTVGGSWGLFDSVRRTPKYLPGIPISNFPLWKLQNEQRNGAGDPVRRCMAELAPQAPAALARLMVCSRNIGNHSRNPVWSGRPKDVL